MSRSVTRKGTARGHNWICTSQRSLERQQFRVPSAKRDPIQHGLEPYHELRSEHDLPSPERPKVLVGGRDLNLAESPRRAASGPLQLRPGEAALRDELAELEGCQAF